MNARALLALTASLFVCACAFWSDRPFFSDSMAVTPIADGARFSWRDDNASDEEAITVVYQRVGPGYEIVPMDRPGETPLRVMLVDVPQTPEEDFIVQVDMSRAGDSLEDRQRRLYAFMWRTPQGFRAIHAPGALDENPVAQDKLAAHCVEERRGGECQFLRAANLLDFYTTAIYPAYVRGDAVPNDYIDQIALFPRAEPK